MATMTVNSWLAWAVFLLAFGTLNRMNGSTSWPIRIATLTIMGSMLMQGFGSLTEQWDHWIDLLLYCGIASYFLACRRVPVGIPWPWNERLSVAVSIGAAVYVMIIIPWTR